MSAFRSLIPLVLALVPFTRALAETTAERFAIADDREAVVASLVPGTDEHFYFRCLLWQHQGKLKEVEAALRAWEPVSNSPRWAQIHARQAVLQFDADPQEGAKQLTELLNLRFNDQPATATANAPAGPQFPQVLDPAQLAWPALRDRALAHNNSLQSFSDEGIAHLLDEVADPLQRRAALQRVRLPTHPRLVELVVADLTEGSAFGSLPIHARLTRAQLDACRAARSELATSTAFVSTYLNVLRVQHDHLNWDSDAVARRRYLEALDGFARSLPATSDPLKVLTAVHLLELDRRADHVDAARLATYLALPRPTSSVPRAPTKPSADVNGKPGKIEGEVIDYAKATGILTAIDDNELAQDCLARLFIAAPDTALFDGLVEPDLLKRLFLEAKLTHGIGDQTQWVKQASGTGILDGIKERSEVRILPGAPTRIGGDDAVALDIEVKNAPELLVRIYEIDAASVYRQTKGEVNAWIDLDGVTPNHQRAINYAQPPLIRHREHLALPECAKPGIWIVDVVTKGRAARALLRKGQLRYLTTAHADGQHLAVFDEANRSVPDARVWVGSQEFSAAADGSVRIPYAVDTKQESLIITGAGRALLAQHRLASENWRLTADVVLDRDQFIAGRTATGLLRPQVTVNDVTVPASRLTDVRLVVTTFTRDQARQVTEYTALPLDAGGAIPFRFAVPERLEGVTCVLHGTVRNVSAGRDDRLENSRTIEANVIAKTALIADLHLERSADGYALVCLGRNGEAIVGRALALSLRHRWLSNSFIVELATDAQGRARLGRLDGITRVTWDTDARGQPGDNSAMVGRIAQKIWKLDSPATLPQDIHINAVQAIRIPLTWSESTSAAEFAGGRSWALWRSDGTWNGDDLSASGVIVGADGDAVRQLTFAALEPGDYVLHTPEGRTFISVAAGPVQRGFAIAADRMLELGNATPLGVGATVAADGSLTVTVVNQAVPARTRVQLIGLRFQAPVVSGFDDQRQKLVDVAVSWQESAYTAERDLGDEYRYILDRSRARKQAGLMLDRPGLVLNPWHDESFMAIGAGGGSAGIFGSRNGGGKRRALAKGGGSRGSDRSDGLLPELDFLADAGVVLANRVPDANGMVRVTAAELGDARQVLIIACDDTQSASTSVGMPLKPLVQRDRRLMAAFPADAHLVYQRQHQVVKAGDQLDLGAGTLDRHRLYASFDELLRLFAALNPEAGIAEFNFLARWPELPEAERRELYGRYVSHELNLFLYHKDRAFFTAVVVPHLRNKLQKTFIDHWLLGDELSGYLAAERHARLNAVERILLARRLGAAGAEEVRSLDEAFAELDDDAAELSTLTATALLDHHLALIAAPEAAKPKADAVPEAKLTMDKEERIAPINNINMPLMPLEEANISAPVEFYHEQGTTQALIEQDYYRVPRQQQVADLVTINRFWRDYAHWDGTGTFLSSACIGACRNRTEILLALALSDLPFKPAAHRLAANGGGQRLTAAGPALLFREAAVPQPLKAGELIVHQQLYLYEDYRNHGAKAEPITGALAPRTAYLVRTVIVNLTARAQTIAVLAQIPAGALPLAGAEATHGSDLTLAGYATPTIEQACYFPEVGRFSQFPTHCRTAVAVVAANTPAKRTVATGVDGGAVMWHQRDDVKAIIAHLTSVPPSQLDTAPIRWRLRDPAFFSQVTALLAKRRLYDEAVWAYAVFHHDAAQIAVYLRHNDDFVQRLGGAISARLLTVDALDDGTSPLVDFAPLTNPRSHRFSGQTDIPNTGVAQQWQALTERLCLLPQLDDRARLQLAYAYTLQDRFDAATTQAALVGRERITARMQLDYLNAYLALGRADLDTARTLSTPYRDYPVALWRLRFGEVLAELEEIAGRPAAREKELAEAQRQQTQAARTATFQATLGDGGTIQLTYAALPRCTVRFYHLDLELLFSRKPFEGAANDRFTFVRPAAEQIVDLDPKATTQAIAIPAELRNRNLAIEVSGAGQRQVLSSFANALDVRLSQGSGQVQVLQAGSGKPLAAVYVKVYTETNGTVAFHKDGYTDLRGRFDYATVSGAKATGAKRLALFIASDEHGSTVREVLPP